MDYIVELQTLQRAAQAAEQAYHQFLLNQLGLTMSETGNKDLKELIQYLLSPVKNSFLNNLSYNAVSTGVEKKIKGKRKVQDLLGEVLAVVDNQERLNHIQNIILERINQQLKPLTRKNDYKLKDLPKFLSQDITLTQGQINRIMGRIKEDLFDSSATANWQQRMEAKDLNIMLRFQKEKNNNYDYSFTIPGTAKTWNKYVDQQSTSIYNYYSNFIPLEHKNNLNHMHLLDKTLKAWDIAKINSSLTTFPFTGRESIYGFLDKIELQICAWLIIEKLKTNFPVFVTGNNGANEMSVLLCSELLDSISSPTTLSVRVLHNRYTEIGVAKKIMELRQKPVLSDIKDILINDGLTMRALRQSYYQVHGINATEDDIIQTILDQPRMMSHIHQQVWQTMLRSTQFNTKATIWYSR